MKSGSQIIKASIGDLEARLTNHATYILRPRTPPIRKGDEIIEDPVKSTARVTCRFNEDKDTQFLQAAQKLFRDQLRDPQCDPPFLLINESGESVRAVIQSIGGDLIDVQSV